MEQLNLNVLLNRLEEEKNLILKQCELNYVFLTKGLIHNT